MSLELVHNTQVEEEVGLPKDDRLIAGTRSDRHISILAEHLEGRCVIERQPDRSIDVGRRVQRPLERDRVYGFEIGARSNSTSCVNM